MRTFAMSVLGLMLMSLSVGGAAPEYKQVPAQLVQTRDGLGNFLTKLKGGGEVRVAYFGGSITAAAGWRVKTLKWLRDTYPQTKITEINAAIGGTGSDLGVYRYGQDVLRHQPDLVFVEFSVNDGGAPPDRIWKAFDGFIRQTWKTNPEVDFCFIYTLVTGYVQELSNGLCPRAASADEMIADYYGIPAINVALRTVQIGNEGKLVYVPPKDAEGKPLPVPEGVIKFSDDGVHPGDAGHQIYADLIIDTLRQWEPLARPQPHALKDPFLADNWEAARMVPLEPAMLTAGWHKLDPQTTLAGNFQRFMPEIWQAEQPGEKIHFKFKGTAVKLYDLLGPDGGQALITLDGKTWGPVPRFDSYCTYHRLATLNIADGLEDKVHEVTVEIHPDQPNRSSVTDREKDKPNFDPKKYDGTVLRVGSIMLIGDLVE